MRIALFTALTAIVLADAARADERVVVYVNDIVAVPALDNDASALTSALCSSLARDPRVDVLCAPDVKQLLSFAAATSMLGTNPAGERLQQRIESTRFVVTGRLVGDAGTVTLTTSIGPRAEGADVGAMFFEAAAFAVEERVAGKASALLDRLPAFSRRLVDGVLAPAPTTDTATPPAPLRPPTAAKGTEPSTPATTSTTTNPSSTHPAAPAPKTTKP